MARRLTARKDALHAQGELAFMPPKPADFTPHLERLHEQGWFFKKDFPAAKRALADLPEPKAKQLLDTLAQGKTGEEDFKSAGAEFLGRQKDTARSVVALARKAHTDYFTRAITFADKDYFNFLKAKANALDHLKERVDPRVHQWATAHFEDVLWHAGVTPGAVQENSAKLAERVGLPSSPLNTTRLLHAVERVVDEQVLGRYRLGVKRGTRENAERLKGENSFLPRRRAASVLHD